MRRERSFAPHINNFTALEVIMMRASAMVLAVFLFGTIAHAESTAEEKASCEGDYKKYCSIVPRKEITMIIAFMKQNIEKLSEQCRKHIEKK
jgi:hypothetical protein